MSARFSKFQPDLANAACQLVECTGYLGRTLSSTESPDYTLGPYIMQSLFLLLGPTLLAASIYMMLGRLIVLLEADDLSLIRPNWLTKVFVAGDVLSFLAQSGGECAADRWGKWQYVLFANETFGL